MKYWAGLYNELDQAQLVEGAELMLKVAKEVLATQTVRQVNLLLLQKDDQDQDQDGTPE